MLQFAHGDVCALHARNQYSKSNLYGKRQPHIQNAKKKLGAERHCTNISAPGFHQIWRFKVLNSTLQQAIKLIDVSIIFQHRFQSYK